MKLQAITADPYEQTDLSDARPEVVEQLVQQIDEWKASLPDSPSGDVFSRERSQPDTDR
ncbi:MAG: hypothetical protein HUJ26_16540 [Planctomycetaceae bacterium]|nr:hypothetical protein [Planctomycetaceae bacterium]